MPNLQPESIPYPEHPTDQMLQHLKSQSLKHADEQPRTLQLRLECSEPSFVLNFLRSFQQLQ